MDPTPRKVEGDTFDPELRELCPDGACIGVIGPDGRCKECGKWASNATPGRPAHRGHTHGPETSERLPAGGEPVEDPRHGHGAGEDNDLEERTLCPDGACIGIIGPDGRCKECGRSAG